MMNYLMQASIACLALVGVAGPAARGDAAQPQAKIPVILDSDIGDDIDDTWALALLLKSPELDLKLVVSDLGDTVYRAKIFCKLLEVAGRTDVPVGVGIQQKKGVGGRQGKWVADYDLKRYPGTVHEDGVGALIRTIMESPEPVTLISIGPMPNIKAALEREPKLAERARFVGMYGSVRVGYDGGKEPSKEWNVVCDPKACQKAFTAPWKSMRITPLDTCGLVRLGGKKYAKVAASSDPLARAVIENYDIWRQANDAKAPAKVDASSVLFDTVAVYLAFATDLTNIERLPIVVTDDGYTRIDPKGQTIECAMSWKNLGGFEDFLVQRLAGGAK